MLHSPSPEEEWRMLKSGLKVLGLTVLMARLTSHMGDSSHGHELKNFSAKNSSTAMTDRLSLHSSRKTTCLVVKGVFCIKI